MALGPSAPDWNASHKGVLHLISPLSWHHEAHCGERHFDDSPPTAVCDACVSHRIAESTEIKVPLDKIQSVLDVLNEV